MSPRHLVLFDIDGTLLSTNGHGVRAMMVAYEAVWGKDPTHVEYRMSGKTELGISHELLALLDIPREEVERGLPHFWERYPQELRRLIDRDLTTVHPGVPELVQAVRDHEQMVLGLLTGNCEAAARIKVEVAGLDGFVLGAFGAHHEDRADLPAVAVQLAREQLGHEFSGKSIVIIGDTPNDIRCGRAVGARTIAVATGRSPVDELAEHNPDFLFEDLADTQAVLAAIQAP